MPDERPTKRQRLPVWPSPTPLEALSAAPFLQAIFGDWPDQDEKGRRAFVEFRVFDPDGNASSVWPSIEAMRAHQWIPPLPEKMRDFNVYVGNAPRWEEKPNTRLVAGRREFVRDHRWVVGDLDKGKPNPWPATIPEPTLVVESSPGHLQPRWKLDRSYPADLVGQVTNGLADRLNGDRVGDAPRILRVPGYFNNKQVQEDKDLGIPARRAYPEGTQVRPLEHHPERVYTLQALAAAIAKTPLPPSAKARPQAPPRQRAKGTGEPRGASTPREPRPRRVYPPLSPDVRAALVEGLLRAGQQQNGPDHTRGPCPFPHEPATGNPSHLWVDLEDGHWCCFSQSHLDGAGWLVAEGTAHLGGVRELAAALGLTADVPKSGYPVYADFGTSEGESEAPATWAERLAAARQAFFAAQSAVGEARRLLAMAAPDDAPQVEARLIVATTAWLAAKAALARVYGEDVVAVQEAHVKEAFPAPRDAEGKVIRPETAPSFYAEVADPRHVRELVKLKKTWRNESSANFLRKTLCKWARAWFKGAIELGGTLYYGVNVVVPEDAGREANLWGAQRKAIGRSGGSYLALHTLGEGMVYRHVFATVPVTLADGCQAAPLEDPLAQLDAVCHQLQPLDPIWTKGPSARALKRAEEKGKEPRARGREAYSSSEDWRVPKALPNGRWLHLGPREGRADDYTIEATCTIAGVKTWKAPAEELQNIEPEVVLDARHYQLPSEWDSDEALMFLRQELEVFVYPIQQDRWAALFDDATVGASGGGQR